MRIRTYCDFRDFVSAEKFPLHINSQIQQSAYYVDAKVYT